MEKIKVLIADDIEETRKVIKKILEMEEEYFEVVGEAANGEEVIKSIPKLKPHIVLMDINMPVLNGLEATEEISNKFPWCMVVIMSVQGENEYLKKAMLHGAKEYIIKPFNYDTLKDTIKLTYEKNKERVAKQIVREEENRDAKIITYFSSKGGVGKSILAVNSSIVFSKKLDMKTLLIDMDLLFGDISMMVNQYTQKTIMDLLDDEQLGAYENIKSYLYNYNENLDILFAPRKPEAAEFISKENIAKAVELFKKNYDIIIIDTGVNFSDNTLYIMDVSDIILYITTMEIPALKNTKLGYSVMQSLGYDNNKVKLVVNKFNNDYGINIKDVEKAFKDGVFSFIPEDDKPANVSINIGRPFADSRRGSKSKILKALENMCSQLTI